jgi:hypothetical protein
MLVPSQDKGGRGGPGGHRQMCRYQLTAGLASSTGVFCLHLIVCTQCLLSAYCYLVSIMTLTSVHHLLTLSCVPNQPRLAILKHGWKYVVCYLICLLLLVICVLYLYFYRVN